MYWIKEKESYKGWTLVHADNENSAKEIFLLTLQNKDVHLIIKNADICPRCKSVMRLSGICDKCGNNFNK